MSTRTLPVTGATLYDRAADAGSARIVALYSTSFSRACRMLPEPTRTHIADVYGLVRLADEVVDADTLDLTPAERAELLDELEAETARAVDRGFSLNLVVHAFARTARACGIGPELVTPFFASMRTDLHRTVHDDASLATYVYGSAEVVGLMCLRVFLAGEPGDGASREARYAELAPGARRLGAAFQKVNFLRDLAADEGTLGRTYFPGVTTSTLTDATRDALLDEIDADLAAAAVAIESLPAPCRRAVRAAHALFAALSRRLRATSAATIGVRRVRVPGPVKAVVVARALLPGLVPDRIRHVR